MMDTANAESTDIVRNNIRLANPGAIVVGTDSPLFIDRHAEMSSPHNVHQMPNFVIALIITGNRRADEAIVLKTRFA